MARRYGAAARWFGGLFVVEWVPVLTLTVSGAASAQVTPQPPPPYHETRWSPPPEMASPPKLVVRAKEIGPAAPVPEPAAEPQTIVRVQAVIPRDDNSSSRVPSLTSVPGEGRVLRLESEANLNARIRQQAIQAGRQPPPFPEEPAMPLGSPARPAGPPALVRVEPAYVCYKRLMFQEKNSERYGWDLGPIQPALLTANFYLQVATAPARRLLLDPCRCYDTNAGQCLPGDPVPYLLYLPPHERPR